MQTEHLLQSLIEQTRQIINKAEKLKEADISYLSKRPATGGWTILECLQHLNLYGDYYLPEIKNAIDTATAHPDTNFKSGWLGNYFSQSMLPKKKLNKMKTFKDKDPINSNLDKQVIDVFLRQQMTLLTLLNESRNVNLNKVRIRISIARFIKLKLGDTFQFLINHMIRHMQQIDRIETQLK